WVGISSMIFGVLYGSYFGYESMYYDWVPEPYWISPMHNIETIFLYAILFGIMVISFSYILGIINSLRMKDWQSLIFSHKGVVAFCIYLIVLTIVYRMVQSLSVPMILYIFLGALSLFLGLERIWDAIIFGHGSVKDWWMGFFDMFEFFLSLLTNTLSFVRIGAFALTHAALMMAVFTLRDLAGGDTWAAYLIIIIGNIFVIGVEGFIVGIQTLRLEYYEFFTRFFRGTGQTFKPIVYK
ncbi:MAG: V-type ATP synthase subunit I, partial [Brevinema sp.]